MSEDSNKGKLMNLPIEIRFFNDTATTEIYTIRSSDSYILKTSNQEYYLVGADGTIQRALAAGDRFEMGSIVSIPREANTRGFKVNYA